MHILLCTTEKLLLTTLEFRFRKNGWLLTIAENAASALALMKKHDADIVVVDLQLPEFAGLDIIQSLRKDLASVAPILSAGTLDDEKLLMESLRLGANDFIIAPYKPVEMVLRIRRQLQGRKVAG